MQESHVQLEARAGVFLSGTFDDRPDPGASNARGFYLATNENSPNGILYYSDGTAWRAVNSFDAPAALSPGASQAQGTAFTVARSDHVHAMLPWAAPIDVSTTIAEGTALSYARSDHQHRLADGAVTAGKIASGGISGSSQFAQGVVNTPALADGSVTRIKLATAEQFPVGALVPFAGSSAPSGWLLCDGASLSTSTYNALFGVISYTYGGSGGTFNVPDLRGRVPVGLDNMGGVDAGRLSVADTLGGNGGTQTHPLTTAELPGHTHSIDHTHAATNTGNESSHTHNTNHSHTASTGAAGGHAHDIQQYATTWGDNRPHSHHVGGTLAASGAAFLDPNWTLSGSNVSTASVGNHTHTVTVAAPNVTTSGTGSSHFHTIPSISHTGNSGSTGSGAAHENMQPYILLNYIIKF